MKKDGKALMSRVGERMLLKITVKLMKVFGKDSFLSLNCAKKKIKWYEERKFTIIYQKEGL